MITTLLATAAAVMVVQLLVWLESLRRRDASIVEVAWGLNFVVLAWVGFVVGGGAPGRSLLLAFLVTVWGSRLTTYLAKRKLGRQEDLRYELMRRRHGTDFKAWSLYRVFGLHAVLAWIVALPVTLAMADATPPAITPLAAVGVVLWLVGLFFEAVGDWQLKQFKEDPGNRGLILDQGLWRFTRHPNYFGDCCVWWGLFVVSAETISALFGVVGPILMTVLLTRASGKNLLERSLGRRRPAYADYVRRTNAFFPGRPHSG